MLSMEPYAASKNSQDAFYDVAQAARNSLYQASP